MAYKTKQQLMLDVQRDVGLVTGTAVQIYTEPLIYASIQTMFDMMFRKRFWDHLTDDYVFTLNGTSGLTTADLGPTIVTGFEDIEHVHIADYSRRIVKPAGIEHKAVSGSSPMFYTPMKFDKANPDTFLKKVIKFWPITATGDVVIRARTKPVDFVPLDIVPFPADIIAMGTAWNLLDNDGINPTAASKAQQLYEMLYSDYVSSLGEDVIGYGSGRMYAPLTIRTI